MEVLRSVIEVGEHSPIEGGGAFSPSTSSEEWRDIPGYEGLYAVSSEGRVKSYPKPRCYGGFIPTKILSLATTSEGYCRVVLCRSGAKVSVGVHRLVLTTFIRRPKDGELALHGNSIRNDNRLSNLRWGTHRDNMKDREVHGNANRGVNVNTAKLTALDVVTLRALHAAGESRSFLSERFGVTATNIGDIVNRKTWKHLK